MVCILYFSFGLLNLIGGFEIMEYQYNCFTGKQVIIWNIAVCIKKHFSYKAGTALLNMFC